MHGNLGQSGTYSVLIDTRPPVILSGPFFTAITQNSATITWVTDELSNSSVYYDRQAMFYSHQVSDTAFTTVHTITLSDLVPASFYHFCIQSADLGGRAVSSKDAAFETLPLPDQVEPSVAVNAPVQSEGIIVFGADASDNTAIARVEFYIDGSLVHIAYTGPYKFEFNTEELTNGVHNFTVKAYDPAGNLKADSANITVQNPVDATDPTVSIISPVKDEVLSGKETVTALITDDLGILRVEMYVDGQSPRYWYPDAAKTQSAKVEYNLDTYQLENGKHRIAIRVFDEDIKYALDTVDITVSNTAPPTPPHLTLTRNVVRNNNYFTVTLTVTNVGEQTATDVRLKDDLQLFQAISNSDTDADYTASFEPELSKCELRVDAKQPIGGGQTVSFSYRAVPVLQYPLGTPPIIGGSQYGQLTDVWYNSAFDGNSFYDRVTLPSSQSSSYTQALSTADYLLVTNPFNLNFFNDKQEVDRLLSSMAELAQLKNGALGFLHMPAVFIAEYEAHDGFTLADIFDNDQQEIILGDRSAGRIRAYRNVWGATNWSYLGDVKCGLNEQGFEAGDKLAAGKLTGGAKDQIVMTDASANQLLIYQFAANKLAELDRISFNLEPYDGLAAGDVDGNGADEILIASRASNTITTLDRWGLAVAGFAKEVEAHDGFAAGDVINDSRAEIIYADRSQNKVFIFNMNGSVLGSFNFNFDEGDGLAVGHVVYTYPDKAEIIISDHSDDRVHVFFPNGQLYKSLVRDVESFDGLTTGDLTGQKFDSVLLADRSENAIVLFGLVYTQNDQYMLQDLIKAGGAWSSLLKNTWTSSGYLLIVGETEIIPAWGDKTFGEVYTTRGDITLYTNATDYPYASTVGSEIKPELSMGRIIGNSAQDLRRAIDTSINVYKNEPGFGFDRSRYFLVSGYPRGLGGSSDNIDFKKERDNIYNYITQTYPGTMRSTMHTPDYTQYNPSTGAVDVAQTRLAIHSIFFNILPDNDVVFLTGHGDWSGWDEISSWDLNGQSNLLGNKNPVVYASSCNTGMYMAGFSVADAFLKKGAGGYIGATIFGLSPHSSISKKFFEKWTSGKAVGLAFKETKQSLGGGESDRYYIGIYHLFGDPKFGSGQSGAQDVGASEQPLDVLQEISVNIPDYEVTGLDGTDDVQIPGGFELCRHGEPIVPYYKVFYDYPRDYVIQDVSLIQRSDAQVEPGLNLMDCNVGLGDSGNGAFVLDSDSDSGWWPENTFEWSVFDNGDRAVLEITIYPFYYQRASGEGRFHNYYRFSVDYVVSGVAIKALQTNRRAYAQGEPVDIDIEIEDEGGAQTDLILQAVIKAEGSDQVVSGLALQSLKGLTGTAAYHTVWDSAGFDPGNYGVEVQLLNWQNTVLAQKATTIQLGLSRCEISALTAQPTHFVRGDQVAISMDLINTGTLDIDGTAVIQVRNESGGLIQESKYGISLLHPHQSFQIHDEWETLEADEGTYRILGYLLYSAQTTDPRVVTVSTHPFCTGDFDTDADVDGRDLAVYAGYSPELDLVDLARNFGRTNCPPTQ